MQIREYKGIGYQSVYINTLHLRTRFRLIEVAR